MLQNGAHLERGELKCGRKSSKVITLIGFRLLASSSRKGAQILPEEEFRYEVPFVQSVSQKKMYSSN